MKKICLILLCAVMPLFLASCERNYYEDSLYSTEFDIRANNWSLQDDSYYAVVLDVKDITKQVCQTGSVQCFMVYDNGSQAALPLQRYRTDPDTGEHFQEMFDFEYSVGVVNLYYTTSDFLYEGVPEKIRIRVVVHY